MICPTCKRAFTPPTASPSDAGPRPPLPFCSPRCRTTDLGDWLSGNYRVVTAGSDDELDSGPDTDGEPSSSMN